MKKDVLLLLSFSFFSLCLFSQSGRNQGYIVLLNGDTLQGTINYRETAKNPNSFTFQSQTGGSETTFQPGEVKRFFSSGDYYVSAKVKTEVSPTKVDHLEKRKTLIFEEVTVFLRALIVGKKSLYYYQDGYGHENFYILDNGQFVLLEYKRYAKQENGRSVVGEVRKYSGQLTLYLSDCSEIQSLLQSVEYRKTSLTKVFSKYYECVGTKLDFEQKGEGASLDLGVLLGVSVTRLNPKADAAFALMRGEYQSSSKVAGGVFLEIVLAKKLKRFSFPCELIYTAFSVKGRHTDVEGNFNYDFLDMEFNYTYLVLNNLIRYSIPRGKVVFFVNAGLSNGVVLKKSSYFKSYIIQNETETILEDFSLTVFRRFEQGFVVGVGVSSSNIFFEARIHGGNGLSNFSLATTRYFGLVGYRF